MSVRPPRAFTAKLPQDPLAAALDQEILAEKAATHGRLLKRFEVALAALKEFDNQEARSAEGTTGTKETPARRAAGTAGPTGARGRLVDEAGEALWHLVIQRELCGFRNLEAFLRELRVPAEVRLRMGMVRAAGS